MPFSERHDGCAGPSACQSFTICNPPPRHLSAEQYKWEKCLLMGRIAKTNISSYNLHNLHDIQPTTSTKSCPCILSGRWEQALDWFFINGQRRSEILPQPVIPGRPKAPRFSLKFKGPEQRVHEETFTHLSPRWPEGFSVWLAALARGRTPSITRTRRGNPRGGTRSGMGLQS